MSRPCRRDRIHSKVSIRLRGNSPPGASPNGYPPAPQASGPNGYPQYPQNGYPPQGQQPGYGNAPQTPPPPVPSTLVIQPGTYVTVRVNQALSSKNNRTGDAFTATLAAPVVVNGVVVAEPGQTIGGRVALAEPSHGGSTGRLGLQLTNLTLVDGQVVPLATQLVSRQGGKTPGGQEVEQLPQRPESGRRLARRQAGAQVQPLAPEREPLRD